ncbi:Retrovirus-related Pol polyprotein [Stylophora pistillata]|uniref:Retrovirus-related Pol polyprotein n=1 Tax=Stylophora pistillata TaxID=50429 RepID=A0A2B4SIN2_STYPI|nr:Retrovirus-related Pol polyprotein [Stylophora pistillata]
MIKRIYPLEENLKSEYAHVFEVLGRIKGVQYKNQGDPNAILVVHPPRQVPVALREPLREELQRMEKLRVIKKCTEPTAWVHSLVVAKKKKNKLRVCMDLSDLSRAVMCEHFPVQTVEDVISRMASAKVFSVLDANHGFWQVKLATDSNKLATFNTPFGRYSYTRLPFGIASALDVFQNVMSHLFQDIEAPVLKFFDPKEPMTLSVDASSKGVGAVLLHNDLPVAYASKALTPSQENYAQMEKEVLTIVFGCELFHDYLYGQREITVQSDHKPLEAILKKPIHQAPLRLQRLILRIKPYAVEVKYIPGSKLPLADTLSRAYLPHNGTDQADEFEIHVLDSGHLSETMFHKLRVRTESDPELQQLQKVVMSGSPQTKVETPVETRPYWNYRDEITCYEGLMFKVARLSCKNSEAIILAMKDMFARQGIPERLIADNMPFNSVKFKDFPEFRSSPISGMDDSLAELLMSRKLRTRLPTSKSLLEPQPMSTSQIPHYLLTRQQRQKVLYDRGTRPLSKLHESEPVRMKQGREWTPSVVI